MQDKLYKQAYELSKAEFEKRASWSDALKSLSKLIGGYGVLSYLAPIVAAGAAGSLAGYGLHKFERRSDPSVSDSNSIDDLRNVERLNRIKYYKQLAHALDAEKELAKGASAMSKKAVHPDSEQMAKWVVNGALTGAGVATAATILRWVRLNRKLKKLDQAPNKGDERTLAVAIPEDRIAKSASNTILELGGAATAGGVASYALVTWLANKIEARRMKKQEEMARKEVLDRLVPHPDDSVKTAGAGWDLLRSQGFYEIAALLAAAAITKKHLDRKARNSDAFKVIKPDNTIFVPATEGSSEEE